jgi:hypothetical protein
MKQARLGEIIGFRNYMASNILIATNIKLLDCKKKSIIYILFSLFVCAAPLYGSQGGRPQKGFIIAENTVLNVGLSISPEFESNITRASKDSTVEDILNEPGNLRQVGPYYDLIMHYSPSLRIKLDDSSKTVEATLLFDYNHYLGLDDSASAKRLSDLDIRSNLLGEFNKNGIAGFDFTNSFSRSANPDGQDLTGRHKNILDNFKMGLNLKNHQDTLYLKIQGGVDINYFEESRDKEQYKDYNYYSLLAELFGRWKFLPRTMMFIRGAYRYQDYYESSVRSDSRSMPVNVFAGLMGQVTPFISAKLSGGYSASFGNNTRHDYNANAEFIFKNQDRTLLTLGYLKNMRPSPYHQYYSTHRLYTNMKQKFARYFLAKLDFSFSFVEFGQTVEFNNGYTYDPATDTYIKDTSSVDGGTLLHTVQVSGLKRNDKVLLLNPSLSYNILYWLGLKLSYEFEYRISDYSRETYARYEDDINSDRDYERRNRMFYDFMNHRVMLTLAVDY